MDAIEILGGLLGGRNSGGGSGGGLGGAILGQILKGATASRQPAPQNPAPSSSNHPSSATRTSPRVTTRVSTPGDLQQEAAELEDLLNVATNRSQERAPSPTSQAAPRTFPTQTTAPANSPFNQPKSRPQSAPPMRNPANNPQQQNDDALVLIRAMINAAKSDGDISEAEQQSILEHIGNPTQEVVNFLRQEFSSPLDVREFAWSVPLGLEQKVYTMSLAAIQLDANHEATYLRDLAHGLRLSPDVCNQIHQQFGAPEIF